GNRTVGGRSVLQGHAALPDPGALEDPLVRRVDVLGELVVRDDPVRDLASEACDRDRGPVSGRADHSPTNTVSTASAATSSPTSARPRPFASGPRTRVNSHSSVSMSPGSTTRLKRQSSMPAKKGILPVWAGSARTGPAPACAIVSS